MSFWWHLRGQCQNKKPLQDVSSGPVFPKWNEKGTVIFRHGHEGPRGDFRLIPPFMHPYHRIINIQNTVLTVELH